MEDIRAVVARNLRKLRQAKSLTQEELAFRAGVDRSYLSQLETADYAASVTMLAKLAEVLEVEPMELLRPAKGS